MILFIIFVIYQILQIILFPFLVLFLVCLQLKRALFGNIYERCGFVPKTKQPGHVIWLHAVSVGEVLSTQELINLIKICMPHAICYLTIGTISAKRIAQTHVKADYFSFLPYDFLPCMLLAYTRIKPQSIIIIESELWPNFLTVAHYKKIPLFLLNARMNKRSAMGIFPISLFFKALLNCFTMIFTQSKQDQTSFESIGVNPSKITTLGNIKAFNVIAKKETYLHSIPLSLPYQSKFLIILVGSMHPGEDDIYLNLFVILKKSFPMLKLVLAPRHFSWQETLIQKVRQTGYNPFVWTDANPIASLNQSLTQAFENVLNKHDIILVCKLGELFNLYPYATVFALGGTFIPVGGHNLLEPAAWAIPTCIGPYYQNCTDIAERLSALDAIIIVHNVDQLKAKMYELLSNSPLRRNIGDASYAWVVQEAHHVQHTLDHLLKKIQ